MYLVIRTRINHHHDSIFKHNAPHEKTPILCFETRKGPPWLLRLMNLPVWSQTMFSVLVFHDVYWGVYISRIPMR